MKQKLLLSFIALLTCLLNVMATNDSNDIFKKYQKGKEIVYVQIDLQKELKKVNAGKAGEDIDVDELKKSIEIGLEKAKVLICFRLDKMFDSELIPEGKNHEDKKDSESASTNQFMNDFAALRTKMLSNNKLSHFAINKNSCSIDCFLPIDNSQTIKEGYLFVKMINGSINALIHFYGKINSKEVIESVENGTFIGISGFEPTYSITTE